MSSGTSPCATSGSCSPPSPWPGSPRSTHRIRSAGARHSQVHQRPLTATPRGTQPETLRLELRDGCAGEAPVRPGHRPLMVIEHRSGVELAQDLNQPGHQAGPPGLVCGTEPGAVVAMEVLVEQDEVPPV